MRLQRAYLFLRAAHARVVPDVCAVTPCRSCCMNYGSNLDVLMYTTLATFSGRVVVPTPRPAKYVKRHVDVYLRCILSIVLNSCVPLRFARTTRARELEFAFFLASWRWAVWVTPNAGVLRITPTWGHP